MSYLIKFMFVCICTFFVQTIPVVAESILHRYDDTSWEKSSIELAWDTGYVSKNGLCMTRGGLFMGYRRGVHRQCSDVVICNSALNTTGAPHREWTAGGYEKIFNQFGQGYFYDDQVAEARRRGYNATDCFNLVKLFLKNPNPYMNKTNTLVQTPLHAAFNNMTSDDRITIQEVLVTLNFYNSTVDGLYGRNTEAAIREFKERHYSGLYISTEELAAVLLKRILNLRPCEIDPTSCSDQQICSFATVWSGNIKSWSDGPYKALAEKRSLTCGLSTEPDSLANAGVNNENLGGANTNQTEEPTSSVNQVVAGAGAEANLNSSSIPLTIEIVAAFYKSEDYQNTLTYASLLALQGNGQAHRILGDLYANGLGVLQLNQNAHMWYNIAALHGDADAMAKRDQLAQTMTADTLAQAQTTALICIQSNFKDCGLTELPEQIKVTASSPQLPPNNRSALINGAGFQYSFESQSTLRRKQLQYAFNQLGLYSSSIDGIWGKGTSQAITNYIKLNDLKPRNDEEVYMEVLSKVSVPNSFAPTIKRSVNRNNSNNAENRAAQQRQADTLINLGTSLMNSSRGTISPSRSIDCYTYGNYTTCN